MPSFLGLRFLSTIPVPSLDGTSLGLGLSPFQWHAFTHTFPLSNSLSNVWRSECVRHVPTPEEQNNHPYIRQWTSLAQVKNINMLGLSWACSQQKPFSLPMAPSWQSLYTFMQLIILYLNVECFTHILISVIRQLSHLFKVFHILMVFSFIFLIFSKCYVFYKYESMPTGSYHLEDHPLWLSCTPTAFCI